MENVTPEKIYKHFGETRLAEEIFLTNRLAETLTEINLKRIAKNQLKATNKLRTIKKEDILYVCLKGIPPFEDEFLSLQLPGEHLFQCFATYEPGLTEEDIKIQEVDWSLQAHRLHQRINHNSTTKPLIFLFHSFGTYLATTYFHLYPHDRIVGLIDLGGAPIRIYPVLKKRIIYLQQFSMAELEKNVDFLFEQQKERNAKLKLKPPSGKYQNFGIIKCFKEGAGFREMFQYNRNWPKVLKCIVYGRKDSVFPDDLMNQKAIFYCQSSKLPSLCQKSLSKKFTVLTGENCSNIQQKYIFNIEEGTHSLHMQRRFKSLIRNIVQEYLLLIEEQFAQENPTL